MTTMTRCPDCMGSGFANVRLRWPVNASSYQRPDPLEVTCQTCQGAGRLVVATHIAPRLLGLMLAALSGAVVGFVLALLIVNPVRSASGSSADPIPVPSFSPISVGSEGRREPDLSESSPHRPPDDRRSTPTPSASVVPATPTARLRTTAPDPAVGDSLRGAVTFEPGSRLLGSAGPDLRAALGKGYRGERVTVSWRGRSVTVTLRGACWCIDRGGQPTLIDLSKAAIARLAGDWRSRGVLYDAKVSW